MTTTTLFVFIGGLVFTAILGGICGYYALKLLLSIEKDHAKVERDRQIASAEPSQSANDKQ